MTELAIHCNGVDKAYKEFQLRNLNLELETGQVMGLIGPNGAGKSTTINILMGLVHHDCGTVRVLGKSMPSKCAETKMNVGYVSRDMRLYPDATIEWHMNFIASLYPNWQQAYADDLLCRFDLKRIQKPGKMSQGQRIKASLLLAFARNPKLLILDEPMTGLDPVARQAVISVMMEVLADESRTILFSSHNTKDVEQLSDNITFIDQGRVISSDNKEAYINRWRRLRVELQNDNELPKIEGIKHIQTSGRLAVATSDCFSEKIIDGFIKSGTVIQAIEHLTLEEIFIAEISGRKGRII